MSKRAIVIRALVLGVSLMVITLYCYRNATTLWVELATELPDGVVLQNNNIVVDLWLTRHNSQHINLSGNYLMQAADVSLPVRITAISYPALHPHQARLSVELVTAEDAEILLTQRRFKLTAIP